MSGNIDADLGPPLRKKRDRHASARASLRLRLLVKVPKSPFLAQSLAFFLGKNGLNAHGRIMLGQGGMGFQPMDHGQDARATSSDSNKTCSTKMIVIWNILSNRRCFSGL